MALDFGMRPALPSGHVKLFTDLTKHVEQPTMQAIDMSNTATFINATIACNETVALYLNPFIARFETPVDSGFVDKDVGLPLNSLNSDGHWAKYRRRRRCY